MVSLSLNSLVIHKTSTTGKGGRPDNLKDNSTNGVLSVGSKKKLKTRITNWFIASNYRLVNGIILKQKSPPKFVFLTLTLPTIQAHSDNEIKKVCLNGFLTKLRQLYDGLEYVWKMEKQKNGNLHFHLILNRFIPKEQADKFWHQSLEVLGYVSEYKKLHGNAKPPTNKIEGIRCLSKVNSYVNKYMAKVEDNEESEGRIWYCSKGVQTVGRCDLHAHKMEVENIYNRLTSANLEPFENEYVIKFTFNSVDDYLKLPNYFRNKYIELLEHYHARLLCHDGIENNFKSIA